MLDQSTPPSAPPEYLLPDLKPIMCKCGRLLGYGSFIGIITLMCKTCGIITVIDGEPVAVIPKYKILEPRGRADLVDRYSERERARILEKAEAIDGRLNTLVHTIENRWDEFAKRKPLERAKIAVGLRFDVFVRDDFTCQYCGRKAIDGAVLEADHVMPRSRGGRDELGNLVTACWDCNRGKSDKPNIDNPLGET